MPKLDFGRIESLETSGTPSSRDSPRAISIAAQKDRARTLLRNRGAKQHQSEQRAQKLQLPSSPRAYKWGNSSPRPETNHSVEHRRMAAALATERARADEEVNKVIQVEHASQLSLQQQVTALRRSWNVLSGSRW